MSRVPALTAAVLALAIAVLPGCRTAQPSPAEPQVASGSPPPPSTPPPPVPPPPPDAAAYLTGSEPALASTGDPRVDAFRDRLLVEGGGGWRPYLVRLFAGVRADRAILAEFDALAAIDTPAEYIAYYVTPRRIARGRAIFRSIGVGSEPGADDGLPYEIALWGALADYGDRPPTRDVFQVLLTLGAYGKGPQWGQFDIFHAAGLVISDRVPRARLLAYATGRIGQPQWHVDQFQRLGRDGDGDRRADIWTNRSDILANMRLPDPARLRGVPLVAVVRPAAFDGSDPAQSRRARALRGPQNTAASILTRWDGQPWSDANRRLSGTYLEPYGKAGPAFLLSQWATPLNHRNPIKPLYFDDTADMGFGLAVALLGEAIAGRPLPPLPPR